MNVKTAVAAALLVVSSVMSALAVPGNIRTWFGDAVADYPVGWSGDPATRVGDGLSFDSESGVVYTAEPTEADFHHCRLTLESVTLSWKDLIGFGTQPFSGSSFSLALVRPSADEQPVVACYANDAWCTLPALTPDPSAPVELEIMFMPKAGCVIVRLGEASATVELTGEVHFARTVFRGCGCVRQLSGEVSDDVVAEVGTRGYRTMNEALAAAADGWSERTRTVRQLADCNEALTIPAGVRLETENWALTGTVTGEGSVCYRAFKKVPAELKASLQQPTWRGTLVIDGDQTVNSGTTSVTKTALNNFGNIGSRIELTGNCKGHFACSATTSTVEPIVIQPEVIVTGTFIYSGGTANSTTRPYACVIFRKLSGTGRIDGMTTAQLVYVLDGSDFACELAFAKKKFVFGDWNPTVDSALPEGSVTVAADRVLRLPSATDNTVVNGVTVDGTLVVAGGGDGDVSIDQLQLRAASTLVLDPRHVRLNVTDRLTLASGMTIRLSEGSGERSYGELERARLHLLTCPKKLALTVPDDVRIEGLKPGVAAELKRIDIPDSDSQQLVLDIGNGMNDESLRLEDGWFRAGYGLSVEISREGATLSSPGLPSETGVYTVRSRCGGAVRETKTFAVIAAKEQDEQNPPPGQLAAIAVPFSTGLDERPVTVATLLDVQRLDAGDELLAFNGRSYRAWRLSEQKVWECIPVIDGDSVGLAGAAEQTQLPRGTAVWVKTVRPIVLCGSLDADVPPPPSTPGVHLLGNATLSDYALPSDFGETGDTVQVPGDEARYVRVEGGWERRATLRSVVLLGGKPMSVARTEVTNEAPIVACGRGYFFRKR